VVDESYNANPASMRAAFSALKLRKPHGQGRKLAVIGEMLELGPDSSEALHASLAEPLAEAGVDQVIGVGAGARALDGRLACPSCVRTGARAPRRG
jgi:UDP-N-acetylmuramoyl-tripeptide--D-alanyl-D-alanine ligase